MNNNIKYYPIYRSLIAMMAWLPVFFLYFNESLSYKEVILLESIYYFGVFIIEVPSGYFSDLMGRKKTLVISSSLFALAYLMFGFMTPQFWVFAVAQVLLAAAFSFISGTDTAFYYESLQEEGLEDTFADREAEIQSYRQYAGALAALLGGVVGIYQFRYGYVISFFFVVPSIWLALKFSEPSSKNKTLALPLDQLRKVFGYLRIAELRWLFAFSIVVYVLAHVPYEFYQPYLKLLESDSRSIPINAALYSGILFAGTRFIGAMISARSIELTRRFGLRAMCGMAIVAQLLIIGLFSWILHPVLVILVLFRSVSRALTTAPVNAAIAPRVDRDQRATYFSMQSLISRLSFALLLVLLSLGIDTDIANDWSTVSAIFRWSLITGIVISIPMLFMRGGRLFLKES